jgi:hypothetical protein
MKMNLKKLLLAGVPLLLGSFGVAVTSCGETDRFFDCQSVCSRYKTCFDSNYDVGACRSRCRDKAEADSAFQQKADACESCIDDKSCTEATFKCGTQCAGVVPQ